MLSRILAVVAITCFLGQLLSSPSPRFLSVSQNESRPRVEPAPETEFERMEVAGQVNDNGELDASASFSLKGGVTEAGVRHYLGRGPSRLGWAFLRQIFHLGDLFTQISDVSFSDLKDLDHPLRLSLRISDRQYVRPGDTTIRIFLPPVAVLADPGPTPAEPIKIHGPRRETHRFRLALPPALSRLTLPPPVELDRDYARYSSSYSLEAGILVVDRALIVRRGAADPGLISEIKSFSDRTRADSKRDLVLETPFQPAPPKRPE